MSKEQQSFGAVSVLPSLGVTDLEAASRFYRQIGFRESWRYPETGTATHLGLCFGEVTVMVWHCESERVERQNLYFIVPAVDPYRDHVAKVLPDVGPVVPSDYGMRDFSVLDPWGHGLTFGEAD